jgi:hypothetical protein
MPSRPTPTNSEASSVSDVSMTQRSGLTKREYYLGRAFQGFCSQPHLSKEEISKRTVAATDQLLNYLKIEAAEGRAKGL